MVELFVMDKDFQILSVVDDFVSLSWNPRFFGVGEWQIECSIRHYDDIMKAKYIARNDSNEVGVINFISLANDEIGGKSVIARGKFIKSLLEDRAIDKMMNFNNETVESVMLALLNEHFIKNKRFERFEIKRTGQANTKITKQMTGGSVLENISKLEEEQKVALVVEYDWRNDKIICYVEVGTNHSQEQTENDWVIFSEELENVYDYEYTRVLQTKNFAFVAGAGEGKDRIIQTVDIRQPGDELLELYVDARDLQEEDSSGNAIPREQYLKNLEQRGREKLAEYGVVQEIEAKVKTDGVLIYKKDYKLGDIVDFVDKSKGIEATLRIVGVNEEIEGGERNLELIFGKERLNLKDVIKREVD